MNIDGYYEPAEKIFLDTPPASRYNTQVLGAEALFGT